MAGVGGATLFGIAAGEGELQRGSPLFTRSLGAALALGAAYTVVLLAFLRPIVGLMGGAGDLADLSAVYMRTVGSFSCAFIANHVVCSFVRNDGAPKLAMASMVLGNLANILLDYIFIYPLGMGMFGAALATGISPVVSLLILSLHFVRGRSRFRLVRCPVNPGEIGRLLLLGVPTFVTELSGGLVIFLFNRTLLQLAGNTGVAAYGIITNIALVCTAIFNGVGQGAQPVVSVQWGGGRRQQARRAFLLACLTALAFGVLFWLCGLLTPRPIAALFNREGDPLLAELTCRGMGLYFSAFPLMGMNIAAICFFSAISQARPSLILSLSRGLAAVLPALLLLPRLLGLDGVWLTVPAAELATALAGAALLISWGRSTPGEGAP